MTGAQIFGGAATLQLKCASPHCKIPYKAITFKNYIAFESTFRNISKNIKIPLYIKQ